MGPLTERFVCGQRPHDHQEDAAIPKGRRPWALHPECSRCGAKTYFAPTGIHGEIRRDVLRAVIDQAAGRKTQAEFNFALATAENQWNLAIAST